MFNNKWEINVIQTLYFIVILGKVNTFIHIYTYMYRPCNLPIRYFGKRKGEIERKV